MKRNEKAGFNVSFGGTAKYSDSSSTKDQKGVANFDNDDNDFWNDCENDQQENFENALGMTRKSDVNNSLSENSVKHSNEPYITFNDLQTNKGEAGKFGEAKPSNLNQKHISKSTKSAINVRDKVKHLIEAYDNEPKNENNELIKAVEAEKKKNAVERCFLLYEKGKIKNEVNRLMYKKNSELRLKQELDNCTFKPKTNKTYKATASTQFHRKDETNIHDRNIYWKSRSIEKIMKSKNEQAQDIANYSHKPKINNNDLSVVFAQHKDIKNFPPSKKFVSRLEKARKEEEFKKAQINKWKRSKSLIMQDLNVTPQEITSSAIDFYKRNLHEELHNCNLEIEE